MSRVRVVTDSSAIFEDPYFTEDFDVSVLPLTVEMGGERLRDGIDIDHEEVFHRMTHGGQHPAVTAPTVEAFTSLFETLNQSTDQVCVLTHSRAFTATYDNARTARGSLLGRCDISVIDSRTLSAGLGFLAEAAARAAYDGASLEEVVNVVRGAILRLYTVFYVSTLADIQRAGLISPAQAMLGTMLEIKPLLTVEDGELITMEKARTHAGAIDKMMEFATEFTQIEKLCILQSTRRSTDQTRMLEDRLALEFGLTQFPLMLYGPLLASRIGTDGMGMVIMEGEESAFGSG